MPCLPKMRRITNGMRQIRSAGWETESSKRPMNEELDEAYYAMGNKEILKLEGIRKTVDLFREGDTRCVYKFLKQTSPLEGLTQGEAVEVFVKELLSQSLQKDLPKPVSSVRKVGLYQLERFGNLTRIVEGWVSRNDGSKLSLRRVLLLM